MILPKAITLKHAFPKCISRLFCYRSVMVAGFLALSSIPLAATAEQQPASYPVPIEREAMRKLSFLAGRWSGPVTIVLGRGKTLHLTQTEDVRYKLNGLVLLIQGKSTSADGKVLFSALATIAYDETTHSYRFRAYHGGHYVDTSLTVPINGFSWGFSVGAARISNTMHLTTKGEWSEVTTVAVDGTPPHPSVEMLLQHQPRKPKLS